MNDSWVNKLTKTSMHSSRMRTAPLFDRIGEGGLPNRGVCIRGSGEICLTLGSGLLPAGEGGVCPILGESAWGGVGQTPLPPVNRMTDRQV